MNIEKSGEGKTLLMIQKLYMRLQHDKNILQTNRFDFFTILHNINEIVRM